MRTSSLTEQFGVIVQPARAGDPLGMLPDADIWSCYETAGAVLFRGFTTDLDGFPAFTSRFIGEPLVNGNTSREDVVETQRIQTVNAGHDLIPLHAEMAYGPMRPDVLFFWCLAPPPPGSGETLVCDGVDVWHRMPSALRKRFDGRRVVYTFTRSRMIAIQSAGHESRLAADARVIHQRRHEDGTMDLVFTDSVVTPTRHDGRPAFANSLIVERDSATFDDGEPIDMGLRRDVFDCTARAAHRITWRLGDILMIDNSRVMHGRRQTQPAASRRIVLQMGWERAVATAGV
jgi:alpha-ketoglutarate-dependent taurine dioxygenase